MVVVARERDCAVRAVTETAGCRPIARLTVSSYRTPDGVVLSHAPTHPLPVSPIVAPSPPTKLSPSKVCGIMIHTGATRWIFIHTRYRDTCGPRHSRTGRAALAGDEFSHTKRHTQAVFRSQGRRLRALHHLLPALPTHLPAAVAPAHDCETVFRSLSSCTWRRKHGPGGHKSRPDMLP